MALVLGLTASTHVADANVVNVDLSTGLNGTSYSSTLSPLSYTGTT